MRKEIDRWNNETAIMKDGKPYLEIDGKLFLVGDGEMFASENKFWKVVETNWVASTRKEWYEYFEKEWHQFLEGIYPGYNRYNSLSLYLKKRAHANLMSLKERSAICKKPKRSIAG